MRDTIDMAREAGCIPVRHPEYDNDVQVFATPDVLKAFEALVRADERADMQKGFAGVKLWLGDAQVTQLVTEVEIQHERVPGTALKQAAEKCLAIYAGARGNT
jgi:hypothetical protein